MRLFFCNGIRLMKDIIRAEIDIQLDRISKLPSRNLFRLILWLIKIIENWNCGIQFRKRLPACVWWCWYYISSVLPFCGFINGNGKHSLITRSEKKNNSEVISWPVSVFIKFYLSIEVGTVHLKLMSCNYVSFSNKLSATIRYSQSTIRCGCATVNSARGKWSISKLRIGQIHRDIWKDCDTGNWKKYLIWHHLLQKWIICWIELLVKNRNINLIIFFFSSDFQSHLISSLLP